VGWGDAPALVVIDLGRAYTEPDGPFALPDAADCVRSVERLVDGFRAAGRPVLWTAVRYRDDLADGGWFVHKVPALATFAEGSTDGWGELTVTPGPGEDVVVKQHASGFAGTDLLERLTEHAVDTLVVVGVSTSGCVRATATDAIAHGLRPIVVEEACADRTPEIHRSNLADLDAKYADVIGLDEALAALHR
jgi:maleamate amidohydrolase